MTEFIEKQIKNLKKSCIVYGLFSLPFAPWPIVILISVCISGIGDRDKLLAAVLTFTFFGIFASVFLSLFFKRFSVYRKLKASRGKRTERIKIECVNTKLVSDASGKRSVSLVGLTLCGSDGKKYFFPFPKRIPEYNGTWTKTFNAAQNFFRKKLKGKKLQLECYKHTNIIHEIKELPNYEIAKIESFTTTKY